MSEWKPIADAPVGRSIIVQFGGCNPVSCMGPYSLDSDGHLWDDATGEATEFHQDDSGLLFIPYPETREPQDEN